MHIICITEILQAGLHYTTQADDLGIVNYFHEGTIGQVCIPSTTNDTQLKYIGRVMCKQLGLGDPKTLYSIV